MAQRWAASEWTPAFHFMGARLPITFPRQQSRVPSRELRADNSAGVCGSPYFAKYLGEAHRRSSREPSFLATRRASSNTPRRMARSRPSRSEERRVGQETRSAIQADRDKTQRDSHRVNQDETC